MNQRTLLGLLLSCTPLPICMFWEHLPRNLTFPELTARIALLSGGPALLLYFGYRMAQKSGRLGCRPFLKDAAIIGLFCGAVISILSIAPAVPRIGGTAVMLGTIISSSIVFVCYAGVFWLVAVRPLPPRKDSLSQVD